jgi:hypothetical protein
MYADTCTPRMRAGRTHVARVEPYHVHYTCPLQRCCSQYLIDLLTVDWNLHPACLHGRKKGGHVPQFGFGSGVPMTGRDSVKLPRRRFLGCVNPANMYSTCTYSITPTRCAFLQLYHAALLYSPQHRHMLHMLTRYVTSRNTRYLGST